jgi:hypothetical protein
MAPDVALLVSDGEEPFAVLEPDNWTTCPHCAHRHQRLALGKPSKKKRVELTLLVHPEWMKGSPRTAPDGTPYGGAAQDDADSTALWNADRASYTRLLEVRGALPSEVTCPETDVTFRTDKNGGNVPGRSSFQCAACGIKQDVQGSVKLSGKSGPWAAYAIQATSKAYDETGAPYGGRYFAPSDLKQSRILNAATTEWERRRQDDLKDYWPKEAIPIGAEIGPHDVDGHHLSHWWTMFNPRQLLSLSLILKAIEEVRGHRCETREVVLSAFQQYLRNQNMFCFWNLQRALEPLFSGNNFHPKSNVVENNVFSGLGRGDFRSCVSKVYDAIDWTCAPWEIAVQGDTAHGMKVETGSSRMATGQRSIFSVGEAARGRPISRRSPPPPSISCRRSRNGA